jgi:hypothetical protein
VHTVYKDYMHDTQKVSDFSTVSYEHNGQFSWRWAYMYSFHIAEGPVQQWPCTLADTINITSQLIRRLPMVDKKTDSWQFQLPVLLIDIGSRNPAAGFTNSDWACGIFNVGFMVSVSVPKVTPHKVERIAAQPATCDATQPIRAQRGKLLTNQWADTRYMMS